MSYVQDNLRPGEQVRYACQIHWWVYVPGILLTPFLIGVPLLIAAWLYRLSTEVVATDRRVLIKTGLLSYKTDEYRLDKVETIHVNQDILSRAMGFGNVTLVGSGGTRRSFRCIVDPFSFRNAVNGDDALPARATA